MTYTDEEKRQILKAFTAVLKDANGKGPKNIFVKYLEDEIHIVMHGVVSDFEQYLIRNFDQEAIDILTDFYNRDCCNSEKKFKEILDGDLTYSFDSLESDFRNDVFIYKMLKDR